MTGVEKLIEEKEAEAHKAWALKERIFPICMWVWGISVVVGIGSCALQVDAAILTIPAIVFAVLFFTAVYFERREHRLQDEAARLRYISETGEDMPEPDDEEHLSKTDKLQRQLDDQRSRAWEFTRLVAIAFGAFVGFGSYWFIADVLDLPRIGAVVGWVGGFLTIGMVGMILKKYFKVP